MTTRYRQSRDWLAYKLGFRRMVYTNFDPPNDLIKEVEPGVFVRPKGTLKMEVVMVFTMMGRLRLLISGKVHVINVCWLKDEVPVLGDVFRWEVLPPYDKADPKLKV